MLTRTSTNLVDRSVDKPVDESITAQPSIEYAVALRLADEGVPLRVIARATKIPSEALRNKLREALFDGRLLELPPHDDWPVGYPRDQRALQLSRMVVSVSDRAVLLQSIKRIFQMSSAEARLLLVLMQHPILIKAEGNRGKAVDVHVCHMRRKLAAFGLRITTVWGDGYQLADRRKAMDLILDVEG